MLKVIFMRIIFLLLVTALASVMFVGCAHVAQEGKLPDGRYCFLASKKSICTTDPVPSDEQEAEAKKFIARSDQQIIWIVRNAWVDPYGKVTVGVDGTQIDMLPNTVSRLILTPGRHQIVVRHGSHEIDKFYLDGKSG